jgi:MFS family permease
MRKVLAVPQIWLTIVGVGSFMICCFFYDPSLAEHVAHVDGSLMLVGSLISTTAFANMFFAPLCGILVDRNPAKLAEPIMLVGAIGGIIFALTLGPSPLIAIFQLFAINLGLKLSIKISVIFQFFLSLLPSRAFHWRR